MPSLSTTIAPWPPRPPRLVGQVHDAPRRGNAVDGVPASAGGSDVGKRRGVPSNSAALRGELRRMRIIADRFKP
jgi:hypothetical protein